MLKRFKDFIIEQSTYSMLYKNVLKFKPLTTKRQSAIDPIVVVDMNIVPAKGMKTLSFFCTTKSAGKLYKSVIVFTKVDFSDEGTLQVAYGKGAEKKIFRMNPIDATESYVKVRCDCADFYYRFAYYNFLDKSIYGVKPRKYVRKTTWFPETNPEHVPGVCKHIIKSYEAIRQAGYIKK